MPFRVYMGYDSHEDITFEVRSPPYFPTVIAAKTDYVITGFTS